MKSGWLEKRLDDVCDLITCGVAARPKYVDDGVPFLSAKNVKNGNIVWNGYNCISKKTHDELTKHNKPLLGDILYTRVGSYGEAAVIEEKIEFSIFVSLTLIKPNKFLLNNYFLKHYLNSNEVKELAKRSINSSGVGNLNVGTVREFPIPLPPFPEQQRIVHIIDKAFDEIATAKVNSEKNLQNARALFESYLHSVFTKCEEGWVEKKLDEVLQLEYGKPLDNVDRKPDGLYPVYGANGEKDRSDKFYFDKPSIIVGRKGSAGELNLTENKFWPLDVTYFVTFDERQQDLRFLFYLLTTLNLPNLAKGVKPGINRNEVYSHVAKFPPLSEQKRIVEKLDSLNEETQILETIYQSKLEELDALKKSLLHQAFTGEL